MGNDLPFLNTFYSILYSSIPSYPLHCTPHWQRTSSVWFGGPSVIVAIPPIPRQSPPPKPLTFHPPVHPPFEGRFCPSKTGKPYL